MHVVSLLNLHLGTNLPEELIRLLQELQDTFILDLLDEIHIILNLVLLEELDTLLLTIHLLFLFLHLLNVGFDALKIKYIFHLFLVYVHVYTSYGGTQRIQIDARRSTT